MFPQPLAQRLGEHPPPYADHEHDEHDDDRESDDDYGGDGDDEDDADDDCDGVYGGGVPPTSRAAVWGNTPLQMLIMSMMMIRE